MQNQPTPPNLEPCRTAPRYARGAVLLDFYRLYVVLGSRMVQEYRHMCLVDEVKYTCMIVAVMGTDDGWGYDCDSHPGQIREFGEGVEMDQYVGETELPATL